MFNKIYICIHHLIYVYCIAIIYEICTSPHKQETKLYSTTLCIKLMVLVRIFQSSFSLTILLLFIFKFSNHPKMYNFDLFPVLLLVGRVWGLRNQVRWGADRCGSGAGIQIARRRLDRPVPRLGGVS